MGGEPRRWRLILIAGVAVALTCAGHRAEAGAGGGHAPRACSRGYYQRDRVVLTCGGGRSRVALMLMPVGLPQRAFRWWVPNGTQDLEVEVVLRALDGQAGRAALTVSCERNRDGEALLVGSGVGVLNQTRRRARIGSARWSWSGDPENKTHGGRLRRWLRVEGPLDCDAEATLLNRHASTLAGDLRLSWSGISPCPGAVRGCAPCPNDVCGHAETASCDGGRYWECRPAGAGANWTWPAPLVRGERPALQESAGRSSAEALRKPAPGSGGGAAGADPQNASSRSNATDGARPSAAAGGRADVARRRGADRRPDGAEAPSEDGRGAGLSVLVAACVSVSGGVCVLAFLLHQRWRRSGGEPFKDAPSALGHRGPDDADPLEDSALLSPPSWVEEQDDGTPARVSPQSRSNGIRPTREGYPPGYEPLQPG
mmetsp:Transcript_55014/g.170840  ORF Transcript_55014/g.170840 Transcript_55014/m.170840 type:complete len:428 (+) Transcript_55014:31-1314(+)